MHFLEEMNYLGLKVITHHNAEHIYNNTVLWWFHSLISCDDRHQDSF